MGTAFVVVVVVAIVANAFSGLMAVIRPAFVWDRLLPTMGHLGIPQSWNVFPIGTLKLLGALGLLVGLLGPAIHPGVGSTVGRVVGTAAAIGLVGYWLCAVFSHVRVGDRLPQFVGAIGFFALAIATLALSLAS